MKSLILSNFNAIILLSSAFCRFRGRRFLHGNLCGLRVHFLLLFRTFDAEIPLFGRSSAVLPLRRFPVRFFAQNTHRLQPFRLAPPSYPALFLPFCREKRTRIPRRENYGK